MRQPTMVKRWAESLTNDQGPPADLLVVDEHQTAFERTPTDKAWQELKRHRQQTQDESTWILEGVGRLESEVTALQSRLDHQSQERAHESDPANPPLIDPELIDPRLLDEMLGEEPQDVTTVDGRPHNAPDTPPPTGDADSDDGLSVDLTDRATAKQIQPTGLDIEQSEAFDLFFTAPDDDLDKERKFLLD